MGLPRFHHEAEGFLDAPTCDDATRIIAFVTDASFLREIRAHLREPTERQPPLAGFATDRFRAGPTAATGLFC